MGRKNPVTIDYLIMRDERWSYHRTLRADIAAQILGKLTIPWNAKVVQLDGRKQIKVALGTTDLNIAKSRHALIHKQVEQLLDAARTRTLATQLRKIDHRLSEDQIRQIGDIVRYEALSTDDALLATPPSTRSPVYDDEDKLVPDYGERVNEAFLSHAQEALRQRDLSYLTEPRVFHYDNGGEAQVEPILDEKLASLGITLPEDHPDRPIIAIEIARAEADALEKIKARQQGKAISTPPKPAPIETEDSLGMRLNEAFKRYKTERQLGKNTALDYSTYIRKFVDVYGNLPIKKITRPMMREFKDLLLKTPARLPKPLQGKPFPEILAWAELHPEVPRVKPQTIDTRGLGGLSAVFGWAERHGFLEDNPRRGVFVEIPTSLEKPRAPYSTEQLTAIFSGPVHAKGERSKGGAGEACYWLPLLALYTGARLDELAQLKLKNIGKERGIDFLEITPDAATQRSVKTATSVRRIPIHPKLIAAGFLQYVETVRLAGEEMLFPDIDGAFKKSAPFSKWWVRYTAELGVKGRPREFTFHSFRHTVKDAAKECEIEPAIVDVILGHADGRASALYGKGYSMSRLHAAWSALDYPDVDLKHIIGAGISGTEASQANDD